MKQRIVLFLVCTVFITTVHAQFRPPTIDKSPMDMSYYPANYPVLKIQNKVSEPLFVRLVYSRPLKNGRQVFGELVEYGKIWRLGANEATEIELFKDAKIGSNKLKKGRYTMYAIPTPEKWIIIFNKETDIWGAFQYDDKKDVLRTEVKTEKQQDAAEAFTMAFEKADYGCNLVVAWDVVKVTLPLTFSK